MSKEPFWEASYAEHDAVTFGLKPNASVAEYEYLFEPHWHILDVGCGEGKNPLYLAAKGYTNVHAFDLSERAIAKVSSKASQLGLSINIFVDDLRTFGFDRPYDVVMSHGTLHFVTRDDWQAFIRRAKEATTLGGLHLMQVFTDLLPASPDISDIAVGLAREGELLDLYRDWHILDFKSYIFDDVHPGVEPHRHASNRIVARK